MDVSSRQGHSCDHIYSLSLALSLSEIVGFVMTPSPKSDNTAPWLDRAWTEKILRELENEPSLSITDYHVRDASSKGDHYMSEMSRISIQLQRASNKVTNMSLIVKKFPPGEEMQKKLAESSVFPNEIKLFSIILPRYQAILEEVAPGRFKPFSAKHIYSQERSPVFLIVTDLAPEGFRMADRKQGLDLNHCLLVMRTLGRFHAASVALHARDPQLIELLKENVFSEEVFVESMQNFSYASIKSLANIVELWPNGGEKMATKLLQVADKYYQYSRQQLSPEGNSLNVLTHGDLWVNNMLFKYNDDTGSVEDVRFVDFQLSCFNSCAIDLQYFIHTSPRDDVRVAHEEDLLREYHNELCSTLQLLGQAEKAITFQELMDEYKRKQMWGFLTTLTVLPLVMADSENAADVEATVSGVDQTEATYARAANTEYVKIMKRLLPMFQKEGLF